MVKKDKCENPNEWGIRTHESSSSIEPPLPGGSLFGLGGNKTLLLGPMSYIHGKYKIEPSKYNVRPWASSGIVGNTETSWNILANTSFVVCALYNSPALFPVRMVLPNDWEESILTAERDRYRSLMVFHGRG